jgi:phosphoenolpyruvate synthase/pyruvate phosphate dikinase
VLPVHHFTHAQWVAGGIKDLEATIGEWLEQGVIVRSSAQSEDSATGSLAGAFLSVLEVGSSEALEEAVRRVFQSYNSTPASNDQVLVQPMLRDVTLSGVAFTRDPANGGHYHIINYDPHSGSTESVTGGSSNNLRTFFAVKGHNCPDTLPADLGQVIEMLDELEELFECDALDAEFAFNASGQLFLLQLRRLILPRPTALPKDQTVAVLERIKAKIERFSAPHPYLFGSRTIFGVMPDWNPAEIIGVRPKPLALSLYKELITDNVWAYQRDNYGYRNLRSFPLLISFAGLPYIDVRISFNSFLPKGVSDSLSTRLIDYYLEELEANPTLHDKVEFDIIFSCYTLDLDDRLDRLRRAGFSDEDCSSLRESLISLTNNIIHNSDGLWLKDAAKIKELSRRQHVIAESNLGPLEKAYWLLEDCKRYGTLPFAGLARAGFIAVQLLNSLVSIGLITEEERQAFMQSLHSVSVDMATDFHSRTKSEFLEIYGHLRPGTYDILSPRYDASPDFYFDWGHDNVDVSKIEGQHDFQLSLETLREIEIVLTAQGVEHDILSFFQFIREAIAGREYAKFVFTKSLSDVLVLLEEVANECEISVEELAFADVSVISSLYGSAASADMVLRESIAKGKAAYQETENLTLPPLIVKPEDVFSFELPENEPNYVTRARASGEIVVFPTEERATLQDRIVMLPSADPGYDWIFSQGIAGFITAFGGANSHMAIRASELGIPAVIGIGEANFARWSSQRRLEIDCANRHIVALQ